jgi:Holliday junction resolvase
MSDFNKVLAFQNMMPYLNKDQQEQLASTLGMSLEEIERRLVGKNKEDEFILILLFMGVCKSITGFDEGVSQLLSTATSDLLVELNSGEKFMLEIKHTDNERFSISTGNLKRRIEYAHKYGLKLYFAISIKGFWLLFDEEYMLYKNGKIDVSDMIQSKLDSVLGCLSYIFPKSLRIKSVYSTTARSTIGIKFEPYGEMVSYELYYGKKRIFRVKGQKSPYLGYPIILEALQDRLSMDSQTIEQDGEFTIINEEFTNDFNVIPEYKFLLAPIEHTVAENGQLYTPHTYIEQAKVDRDVLNSRFQLGHIRGMMQYLANNGVDISYIKDNYIYKLNPKN